MSSREAILNTIKRLEDHRQELANIETVLMGIDDIVIESELKLGMARLKNEYSKMIDRFSEALSISKPERLTQQEIDQIQIGGNLK